MSGEGKERREERRAKMGEKKMRGEEIQYKKKEERKKTRGDIRGF